MLDEILFNELLGFLKVHFLIKAEEDGECSDPSKKDYREFRAL
jgi:hypothetical protein